MIDLKLIFLSWYVLQMNSNIWGYLGMYLLLGLLTYLKDVEAYLVSQMDEAEQQDHGFDGHEVQDCILCQTRAFVEKIENGNFTYFDHEE